MVVAEVVKHMTDLCEKIWWRLSALKMCCSLQPVDFSKQYIQCKKKKKKNKSFFCAIVYCLVIVVLSEHSISESFFHGWDFLYLYFHPIFFYTSFILAVNCIDSHCIWQSSSWGKQSTSEICFLINYICKGWKKKLLFEIWINELNYVMQLIFVEQMYY